MEVVTVGIIGAGTMGSGIAQKFAQQGFKVILVDIKDEMLDRALNSIRTTLNEGVSRKLFTPEQVEEILARITFTTDLKKLATCQLVIEAVFEDIRVKKDLFQKLSSIVPDDCIVATNTSSFSVTDLASSFKNPDRFIGLHFFYHAAKNRLVEVIPGAQTSRQTMERAMRFIRRLDKDPIQCKDSNGFVVNRFFVPWLNEAVRMNEEGIASKKVLDEIFCDLFGVSMGPFALMNATGVPIAYHSQETLHDAFGKLYEPADSLKRQALRGEPWSFQEDIEMKTSSDQVDSSIKDLVQDRILGLMFLIWGQLLSENVCKFGDIHRGAKIGLRWRNGPYQLVKSHGKDKMVKLAMKTAEKWNLNLPSSLMTDDWEVTWKPEFIKSQKRGNVGYLIINRPEDLNALNPTVIRDIERVFLELEGDDEVEIIVITGTGKAFAAGADIKFFVTNIENDRFDLIYEFTKHGQDVLERIDNSSKHVITFMNGLALGGGLELALCGDIIVASSKAVMGFPETGIGIYPGLGGTQRAPRKIGIALAKYLIYTGVRLNSYQSLEIGLVDRVLSWQDIDLLMDGDKQFFSSVIEGFQGMKSSLTSSEDLDESWKEIITFFEEYSVKEILEMQANSEILASLSPVQQKLCRRVARKAPVALKLAEKLINDQKGPQSELNFLEEVFKTKDALLGLKSIIEGYTPQFKGE